MAQQVGSMSDEMETLNQVLRMVEAFRAFDSNNDGSITATELSGILSSLGYKPSEQEVRAMMQQGDANRDGLMSIEEFMDLNTKHLELGGLGTSLKAAFEALVSEGDEEGEVVTTDELYDVMVNMGIGLPVEVCEGIVASMDGDGDGAVNLEDLKLIVNSLL